MALKGKLPCEFGNKCYRKNPKHFELYFHPEKFSAKENNPASTDGDIFAQSSHMNRAASLLNLNMKKSTWLSPKTCDFLSGSKSKAADCIKRKADIPNNEKNLQINILRKDKESRGKRKDGKEIPKVNNNKKIKTSKFFSVYHGINNYVGNIENNCEGFDSVQSISDVKNSKNQTASEIIKTLFLVDMPSDFYSFYEFCKSVNESFNSETFQLGELKLVGPFDILSGKMNYAVDTELLLCHWRFYYDPPEFQTVLATGSGFHIGYWRDNPKENPVFLASNNPNKDCIFKIEAENIFGTVYHYLSEFIKNCDPFKKVKIAKLQKALSDWAEKNKFSLENKSYKMNLRQKKVVAKTFHGAGIVVLVDAKTEIGYRPLIETDADIKKICKLIMKANNENDKDSLWENLQPLITAANIANDECDFGNGLELGIDLFCMGSLLFHETIEHLLSTAYFLLDRPEFGKVIKAHLKFRRKEISKKKLMTRLEFTSSIISEIEHEWMQAKQQQMINYNEGIFGLVKLPGRNLRQCVVCSSKVQCKKGLHALCFHKLVCFKK